MENEWKVVKLEFNNASFIVRTDGETIRIRGKGLIPQSCQLGESTNPHVPVLKMKKDVTLKIGDD